MAATDDVVFLLDVDNTLLDNDRLIADLMQHLAQEFGSEQRDSYQAILEQLRSELGYVDYLGAMQRFRLANLHDNVTSVTMRSTLQMSAFLLDYPFAKLIYPGALDAIAHLRQWGRTVILSDGDVIFQPRKIERSGLSQAVDGQVLVYVHKEQILDEVARLYPARHYVMVDDKLSILSAMKNSWGRQLTTVFPRQGHYAHDPKILAANPAADITLEQISALAQQDFSRLAT